MATVTSERHDGVGHGEAQRHDEAEADDDADGDESVGERVGRIRREDLALEPLRPRGARTRSRTRFTTRVPTMTMKDTGVT